MRPLKLDDRGRQEPEGRAKSIGTCRLRPDAIGATPDRREKKRVVGKRREENGE